ncbi:ABC transporter ATP-binding protein [Pseudonocardia endophytica]|uniref:ATP-binding cassette subfamily B protein n=1 Tax=Pseudonocardia endophytica TaxID=401976 RepID=A0A4R1HX89_PSEEN|nr:ABC transporter ATP-binding protein [Pseudonocardia endophytica]TCK25715.1 ATP-binding cassette subfamily B protein [Pseudonocardia endophytica]
MTAAVERPARTGAVARLWALAGPRRARLARGVGFRFLQSVCAGIPFAVLVLVIDQLRTGTLSTASAWGFVAVIVLGFAGQLLFGYLSARDTWLTAYQLVSDMRLAALDHLRRLPMSFHIGRRQGETSAVFTNDMQAVEGFASNGLSTVAQALGLPLVVFAVLVAVDPLLAVATLVSIVVALPVLAWSNRRFTELGVRRQDLQANATSRMIEYVQGVAVIRAFNQAGSRQESFRRALDEFREISVRMVARLLPGGLVFAAVVQAGIPIVITAATYWLLGGRVDVPTAILFLVLSLTVFAPVLALLEVMETLRLADASLSRIDRVMREPEQSQPATPATPSDDSISFDDVVFGYRPGRPVLDGVTFTVPARSMTALVGPSGAGKSTVLNLVGRFWDVDDGAVRIGGADVRDLTTEQLHDRISVVFQDVYLFQGSVYDNIAFGSPDATPERVEAAARAAQAHEFVRRMPEGYASRVGEGGASLSGGERQRISIARAILKDAPIVLLDEATAAIDPTNERLVQEALATLVADRTLLVVAHKLTTIRHSDQILVLDGHGGIAQRGTHDELIDTDGSYARFWSERHRASGWRITTSG